MAKKSDPDFITCMAEECIGFRMRRLNRIISSYYDEGLRPFKAKISQMNLLVIIARTKQITPSQLGQFAQADASTLSRNIERMINRDWVKTVATEDGRSHLLTLTAEGKKMLKQIYPAWKKAQQKTKKLLGEELVQSIQQIDHKLLTAA